MIKRLVWTLILLSPMLIGSFLAIFKVDLNGAQLFNAGAVISYTWNAIQDFISLFKEDKQIWGFVLNVILAAFFMMPFIFVWRGLFFLGWIPLLGTLLRIIVLVLLLALPGILAETISSIGSVSINDVNTYLQTGIMALAMIGVWLPKSITTK